VQHRVRLAADSTAARPANEPSERTLPPATSLRQRRLAQRLALVTAAHQIGVWEIDADRGTVYWNAQMLELYGIEASEMPRHTAAWLERHVLADDRDMVLNTVKLTLQQSDPVRDDLRTWRIEHRIVRGDGSVRWVESQSAVMTDEPAAAPCSARRPTSPPARMPSSGCARRCSGCNLPPNWPAWASSCVIRSPAPATGTRRCSS
jgi:PAS domain-containing protein